MQRPRQARLSDYRKSDNSAESSDFDEFDESSDSVDSIEFDEFDDFVDFDAFVDSVVFGVFAGSSTTSYNRHVPVQYLQHAPHLQRAVGSDSTTQQAEGATAVCN